MGYKITVRDQIGRTEVIKVLPNKKFEAVADNRGDDAAEGYWGSEAISCEPLAISRLLSIVIIVTHVFINIYH